MTAAGVEWISVGDSPFWLARNGRLIRMNEDHSMAPVIAKQMQRGELTAQMAAKHPDRHLIRSAVMGEKIALVDRSGSPVLLEPRDRLILASDGLLTLSEDEITEIASAENRDATSLAAGLIEAVDAKSHPHQDNTTVLVAVLDRIDGGRHHRGASPDAGGGQ